MSNNDASALTGERFIDPPGELSTTRHDLHRLAAYAIAPARHAATGRFGLRSTPGGFGTPPFEPDRQIRTDGLTLIDRQGTDTRSVPITTLNDAAAFLQSELRSDAGAEHDSPELGDTNTPLKIDSAAADYLADWFAVAFDALGAVQLDDASTEASPPQLWPGHFDPAIEIGDENRRASYGASPGDHNSDEPYLYVSLWWPDRLDLGDDPRWNATAFTGAVLPVSSFAPDRSAVEIAADFWRTTRHAVNGSAVT